MEDLLSPVELYQSTLKEAHARNTFEFFEDLVRQSQVDAAQNAVLVDAISKLDKKIGEAGSSNNLWKVARVGAVIVGLLCAYLGATQHWAWFAVPAALTALVILKLNPAIRAGKDRQTLLKGQRDAKEAEAWAQMAPLNRLYGWDIFSRLVQQTTPLIEVDRYFTEGRLGQLREGFGWDDEHNRSRSIVFAHSGLINGNPFVFAHTLRHRMGTKRYTGSLRINWTEQVRDSDGKMTTVSRSERLDASVTKPFPEFTDEVRLIYGNQAAPDLSFSRAPSSLSGLDEGLINNWRKDRAIKKLEAISRDLSDGSDFTVMANREFDALFGATNRDHEVQFRLLFTPLAQQEMVKLLKDKTVGFGDDFYITKLRMINLVEMAHASNVDISSDPRKFHSYDLATARQYFNAYHNSLFKTFFFNFAPLLTIPLYQQHRTHEDIYKDVRKQASCYWEHESIANYMGEDKFAHPSCITRSILKAETRQVREAGQVVQITAHGYGGINRVDHVSVRGGDGRYHRVSVKWVEYVSVSRDSNLLVRDGDGAEQDEASATPEPSWLTRLVQAGIDPSLAVLRRSIVSAMLPA